MRVRISTCCAAIGLLITANAFAGNVFFTERMVKELPLEIAGSLWIDNPVGSIEIVGSDGPGMVATVVKTTTAADKAALSEGREQTMVSFEGDRNVRLVRTLLPPMRNGWTSNVSYSIRVPRTIHVRVAAKIADRIRVANISGNVTVRSFSGTIVLDGVTGASIIDTTNGKVIYVYHQKPSAHAQVQAVNADIDINVPPDSNFNWIADTLRGDVVTNLPVRAEFQGSALRGTVNAPGGPTLSMQTLIGSIRMLGNGLNVQNARSLREDTRIGELETKTLLMRPARRIQLPIAAGAFDFSASIADVEVGEVRGPARVQTAAGEIRLGMVYGDCNVLSLGGPLDLGDIMGTLLASTEAGDVLVRAAREGGRVSTAGGIIRILYTGGPTTLRSGGGDIVVRQAAGPINAETRSGDINITADPAQRTQKIQAHTLQGNIVLSLSPHFAGDIDATVLTSDPKANAIHSDFKGLRIKKEQVGGRTRIHATGKLNGGGERVELIAEEGDIHISNLTTNPVTLMSPLP